MKVLYPVSYILKLIHFFLNQLAEKHEMQSMMQLREENDLKKRTATNDTKFCICRRSSSGIMVECALCKEWYHGKLKFSFIINIYHRPGNNLKKLY